MQGIMSECGDKKKITLDTNNINKRKAPSSGTWPEI